MIKKPEPLFESISDMRLKSVRYTSRESRLIDLSWFPCLACNGSGKVYDPFDPSDPIEGRKMCSMINCQKCNGTGDGSKKEFYKKYKEYRKEYLDVLKKYKKSSIRLKKIKKILSKEDMDLIRRYTSHYSYEY